MSPIKLNGSTSGFVALDAPAAAGSNTLVLPTGNGSANQILKNGSTAGSLAFGTATEDSSGNFAFNSGYGSVATAYGCRAWVNFNGTGTVAIRASGNVSSITDNGTGDYTVNFTTAMADANYAITTAYRRSGGSLGDQNMVCTAPTFGTTPATSNVRVGTTNAYGGGREDTDYLSVAIFR